VKELIASMLNYAEKVNGTFKYYFEDRISWDGIFKNATIKIDESKIKQNFESIIKEKGIYYILIIVRLNF
jgi:hypothetical protein